VPLPKTDTKPLASEDARRKRLRAVLSILKRRWGAPDQSGTRRVLDSLVLTILSQNTNATNRDRAYESLRERFPTWEGARQARAQSIAAAIRVGGLANQKARNIKNLLRWADEEYGSLDLEFMRDWPSDAIRETLLPLPGVGVKTVSVLLCFTLGRDVFPIDTHVSRVCRRLGLVSWKTSIERAHEMMQDIVPKGRSFEAHLQLIRFGREICHARKPECAVCPIIRHCQYPEPPE